MDKSRGSKGRPADAPGAAGAEEQRQELHDLPPRAAGEPATLDSDDAEQVRGGANIDAGIKRAIDL